MVILASQIVGKNNRFALFTHKLIRTENRPQGEYVIDQMIVDKTIPIEGYLEDSDNGLEVLQRSLETFIRDNYSDPNLDLGMLIRHLVNVQHGLPNCLELAWTMTPLR